MKYVECVYLCVCVCVCVHVLVSSSQSWSTLTPERMGMLKVLASYVKKTKRKCTAFIERGPPYHL